jgi:phage FluMu protein Com
MYGIIIEDGVKHKCPHCNAIYAIENEDEILYRNITLLHRDKTTNKEQIKCKQCKNIVNK